MGNRGAFLEPARANSVASARVNGKHLTPDFKKNSCVMPGLAGRRRSTQSIGFSVYASYSGSKYLQLVFIVM